MNSGKISYDVIAVQDSVFTVQVKNSKKSFYLHSMVDPYDEAAEWVRRIEVMPNTLYLVLGAGLGYHIRALAQKIPTTSYILVLYTPSELQLLKFAGQMKKNEWLSDERISFLQLTNIHDLSIAISDVMLSKMVKKIHLCRHFPAMRLAEQEYKIIEETLIPEIEKGMLVNFNVNITTNYKFFENYWCNFASIFTNPGVKGLAGAFTNRTVIIVAAGPSLDNNIQKIKECSDKAVIIAAGTAIGALYKQGIIPHFLVVTDAHAEMYDVIKDYLCIDTVLVTSTTVQHQVVANYPGIKCFVNTHSDLAGEFATDMPETTKIRQAVSVATAAVDFAKYCGAQTIVVVGQDLSFPKGSGQQHAQGVTAGSYEGWDFIKIPGYYGGEVDSNFMFNMVIQYYNQYVIENPHIDFINATEGGALITGMRNMPLAEVCEGLGEQSVDIKIQIREALRCDIDFKKYKNIRKKLYSRRNLCGNLAGKVNEFFEKEIASLVDSTGAITLTDQLDISVFENFYKNIMKHPAYQFIQNVMEMRLGYLKFQVQDGMPIHLQYHYYINMTSGLREILNNFVQKIDEIIKKINNAREALYGK